MSEQISSDVTVTLRLRVTACPAHYDADLPATHSLILRIEPALVEDRMSVLKRVLGAAMVGYVIGQRDSEAANGKG